jgi:hypothetical protein
MAISQGLEILELRLKSHRRTSEPQWLDLLEYYSSFELVEDIFLNCIHGTLILNEIHNIASTPIDKFHTVGPIIGNEEIHITIQEKKNRKTLKLVFHVYNISNRFLVNTKKQATVLNLVTPEFFEDQTTRISKSYRDKKYSAITADILFNDLKTRKRINFEETDRPKNIIIPHLNPFAAINWLASKSISPNYLGASYLFFETINFRSALQSTFHFVPLEKLYEKPSVKTLKTSIANIIDLARTPNADDSAERINAYSFSKTFNIIDNIKTGMYANHILQWDILNKKTDEISFNYLETYPKLRHLSDEGRLVSKLTTKFTQKPESNRTVYTYNNSLYDGTFQDKDSSRFIPFRKSQIQQLNNVKINVTIPADPSLSVGDVINLEITSPKDSADVNSNEYLDKYYRGKFLITCVRHIITTEAPNFGVYSMTLELSKDTLFVNPLMESEIYS